MAKKLYEETNIQNIADAIREKNGSSDTYQVSEMAEAISEISGGGSEEKHTGHVDRVGLTAIGWTEDDINDLQEGVWWDSDEDDYYKLTEDEINNPSTHPRFLSPTQSFYSSNNNLCAIPRVINSPYSGSISQKFQYCGLYVFPRVNLPLTTNTNYLFRECLSLTKTYDINMPKNINISSMFYYCKSLKETGEINAPLATTAASMFYDCMALKKTKIVTSSALDNMNSMFYECTSLQKIEPFDTSGVTLLSNTFYKCASLDKVNGFDFSNVSNTSNAFCECYSMRKCDNTFLTPLTNASNMFKYCSSLEVAPLIYIGNNCNCDSMYSGCRRLKNVPNKNYENASSTSNIFSGCYLLEVMDNTNLKKSANTSYVFADCRKMKSAKNIIANNSSNYSYMFSGCSTLTELTFSESDFEPVNTSASFQRFCNNCSKLKKADLRYITKTVTSVNYMFSSCISLEFVDIRGLICSGISTTSSASVNAFPTSITSAKIVVKDGTEKAWWQLKYPTISSCFYTVEEAIEAGIVED